MKISTSRCAALVASALLGCASGASPKHESVTAPGADLAGYATFGWQAPSEEGAPLSILDASIHDAIRTQLVQKGYREVAEKPDLRIGFETVAYIAEKVHNPVQLGVGVGSWGGNVGGGVSTSVPVGPSGVVSSQEMRLSIHAVDQKANREVWVGTSTGEITGDASAAAVQKTVAGTMADFPSRRK